MLHVVWRTRKQLDGMVGERSRNCGACIAFLAAAAGRQLQHIARIRKIKIYSQRYDGRELFRHRVFTTVPALRGLCRCAQQRPNRAN